MGGSKSTAKASGAGESQSRHVEEVAEAASLATQGGLLENDLSSRVEIHVRVARLRKKVNPCCIIYTRR